MEVMCMEDGKVKMVPWGKTSDPHSLEGALDRADNAYDEWKMYKSMGDRYLPVGEQHFSYMLMALHDVMMCLKKEELTATERGELDRFLTNMRSI